MRDPVQLRFYKIDMMMGSWLKEMKRHVSLDGIGFFANLKIPRSRTSARFCNCLSVKYVVEVVLGLLFIMWKLGQRRMYVGAALMAYNLRDAGAVVLDNDEEDIYEQLKDMIEANRVVPWLQSTPRLIVVAGLMMILFSLILYISHRFKLATELDYVKRILQIKVAQAEAVGNVNEIRLARLRLKNMAREMKESTENMREGNEHLVAPEFKYYIEKVREGETSFLFRFWNRMVSGNDTTEIYITNGNHCRFVEGWENVYVIREDKMSEHKLNTSIAELVTKLKDDTDSKTVSIGWNVSRGLEGKVQKKLENEGFKVVKMAVYWKSLLLCNVFGSVVLEEGLMSVQKIHSRETQDDHLAVFTNESKDQKLINLRSEDPL